MTSSLQNKAGRYATELLDNYGGALDSLETAHMLLRIAYLRGSMDGAEEAVGVLENELAKVTAATA